MARVAAATKGKKPVDRESVDPERTGEELVCDPAN